MENLNKKTVTEDNVTIKIPKWISITTKFACLAAGIFIAYLLWTNCLSLDYKCNPIVVIFFVILGLSFFMAAGIPIEKILKWLNIKIG